MTIHRQIVAETINSISLESGFSATRLDESHSEIWCSSHSLAPTSRSESDLNDFTSHMETVDSHEQSPSVVGQIAMGESNSNVDTSPYPNKAAYNGTKYPTERVDAGIVIWDEG